MERAIDLRSGKWTWSRLDVRDPGAASGQVLIELQLEGVADSKMRLYVNPADGDIDSAFIAALASHPAVREIGAGGESWECRTLEPLRPPHRVSFRSSRGSVAIGDLPSDMGLGEATDDELRAIINESAGG